jgi:TolA-binding protein
MARRATAVLAPLLAAGLLAAPAHAQNDERVRKLEAEVRALQRAVFPGGAGQYFEPEISPAQPQQPAQPVGTPSESALTDVLARLSAIESQLARLTASTEVNANALQQLETRMDEGEAALANLSSPTGLIPVPGGASPGGSPSASSPGEPAPLIDAAELPPISQSGETAGAAGPTPQRVSAVQAIAKPATADAGDDEYVYGFRLWEAGFYPEAQQQLSMFLERYPDHWRTNYGRNLLGRAFLDAGNARQAANFFFENYQADKQAPRAPDSLLYLAESMVQLGDTNRACIALAEFGDTYPALATGRLQQQYDANRARVDCE